MAQYYEQSKIEFHWGNDALFPLSLLTAIGNGQGGGDYFSPVNLHLIGTWAFDEVYFSDILPTNYQKLDVWFKE